MNNRGAMPNMTIMVIGISIFVVIITLLNGIYTETMVNNGGNVSSTFAAQYAELTGYGNNVTSFANSIKNQSIWTTVPSVLASTFNVLVIGISGIGNFFSFVTIIPQMFNTLADAGGALAIPAIIFSFITSLAVIYVVMKSYKAIRNSGDEV